MQRLAYSKVIGLGEKATQFGYLLDHVDRIGSTSSTLMENALAGATGAQWLVADEQVDGKGRRGRFWNSPKGNLYSSLLLSDPAEPEQVAQLSFVAALALRDAVLAVAAKSAVEMASKCQLKWPNDLMIEGKKCAGLLLEGGISGQSRFVVIGIGVNINSFPEKTNHPACSLQEHDIQTSVEHLFPHLSDAFASRLMQWSRGNGFEDIRADWLNHAFKMGEEMRINTSTESFVARIDGVDAQGSLIVDQMGRMRTITAGEIFPLDTYSESNKNE